MRFWVIMACHNRRELTVSAVTRARASAAAFGIDISFTVFDDGSTDGTARALEDLRPEVDVIRGDGTFFWAKSMATAEAAVLARDDLDEDGYVVWLNDDVNLDLNAMGNLSRALAKVSDSIVVGAMRSSDAPDSSVSYSGLRRTRLHPLSLTKVVPLVDLDPVDAFNGNLVAVPINVARSLGGIDGGFSHALADIDYGIRARRAGYGVRLLKGTQGVCPPNTPQSTRSLRSQWVSYIGTKGGGNYDSMKRILRRTNPRTWWMFVASTYGLWWIRKLFGVTREGAAR